MNINSNDMISWQEQAQQQLLLQQQEEVEQIHGNGSTATTMVLGGSQGMFLQNRPRTTSHGDSEGSLIFNTETREEDVMTRNDNCKHENGDPVVVVVELPTRRKRLLLWCRSIPRSTLPVSSHNHHYKNSSLKNPSSFSSHGRGLKRPTNRTCSPSSPMTCLPSNADNDLTTEGTGSLSASNNSNNHSTWNGLSEDLQLHILQFLDISSVRNVLQVNLAHYSFLMGLQQGSTTVTSTTAASSCLWRSFLQARFPWLSPDVPLSQMVDDMELPVTKIPAEPATTAETTTTISENNDCAQQQEQQEQHILNFNLLLSMAATSACSAIDESLFPPCRWSRSLRRMYFRTSITETVLRTVSTESGRTAVQFLGTVGTGDRCVRANEPLPKPKMILPLSALPAQHHSRVGAWCPFWKRRPETKGPAPWKPFVAPFLDSTGHWNLSPRLVSYFEVSILPPPPAPASSAPSSSRRPVAHGATITTAWDHNNNTTNANECVAIGIALKEFSLHSRQPGWDLYSYGYHGDDGGIFHGSGHRLKAYGPHFGVGDTVGCGIDYSVQQLFFTKNGTFLYYALPMTTADLQRDWYPVVGIDTHCLVECNFGGRCAVKNNHHNNTTPPPRPFQYDLVQHIQHQRDAILAAALPPAAPAPSCKTSKKMKQVKNILMGRQFAQHP